MAKRRRRGLGSSAEEHRIRAHNFTMSTINYAVSAQRNAEGRSCREALADLIDANRSYGAASQEYRGAQPPHGLAKTRASAEFSDSVSRAQRAFLQFCTRE